jgi:hypothetical protein
MTKRLDAMRNNPHGDWKISDVEALSSEYGLVCKPPSGGGSHYKIAHPDFAQILTIPSKRPIKAVYIKKLVRLVDAVRSQK